MDVKRVINSDSSINICKNPDVSQYNITADSIKAVSSTGDEKDKEIKDITFKNGVDKEKLDKALNKLNRFLEDEKTHAEYSVHKELGTIMIRIVKDETKEVLLEVPPKKILDMVASMCEEAGLIDKKA